MHMFYLLVLIFFSNSLIKETVNTHEAVYNVKLKEVNASGRIEKSKGHIYLEQGQLFSDFSNLNGFSKANYHSNKLEANGNVIEIKTTSNHDSGAVLKWEVKLEAQTINGWAIRNDTGTTYYFKGKLKK